MNKKVCRVLLSLLTVSMSVSSAFAFGGTYPEHPQYAGMAEQGTSTKESNTESDSRNVFSVDGKRFILLDTDKDGNYFVMTDDLYGKYTYDTTYTDKPVIKTRKANGTFIDGPAMDVDDAEWMFDTEDDTNIGYWLNNDFWKNGNGEGYLLPEDIKNNVIEAVWQVEGMKAVRGWTANLNFDSKYKVTYANDFTKSRVTEPYQVTGKLALMSYTEYLKYQNIIGLKHNEDSWRGFMLRTPHAVINGDTSKIFYTYGGGMVKNNTSGGMLTCVNDTPATASMFVRPVMWLDNDFFKNVKVDISTAGQYPMEEIRKLSIDEMLNIYTFDEIKLINSVSGPSPKITDIKIIGTPAVGSILYLDYDFVPYTGGDEGESKIYWLVGDEDNGYKIALTDEKKYTVTEAGKKVKCVVIPCDESGIYGEIAEVDAEAETIDAKTFVISDIELTDEKLTVKLTALGSVANARMICALYDANGKLISVNAEKVSVETDTEAEITLFEKNEGEKMSVMVLAEENQPVLIIQE